MAECINSGLSDLEYWRRRLVTLVKQRGSLTHADVLRVSRILDELIVEAQRHVAHAGRKP